jgi:hypothetical protein
MGGIPIGKVPGSIFVIDRFRVGLAISQNLSMYHKLIETETAREILSGLKTRIPETPGAREGILFPLLGFRKKTWQ